jgi:hypothetical protein
VKLYYEIFSEKQMDRFSPYSKTENRLHMMTPVSGLSEARLDRKVVSEITPTEIHRTSSGQNNFYKIRNKKMERKPPRGRPFGGGGVHRT